MKSVCCVCISYRGNALFVTLTVQMLESSAPRAEQLDNIPRCAGRLFAAPMDDQSDAVAILLRRDSKQQLWLDFGMTLTDLPQGFKPHQMVNVTGTMKSGYHLLLAPNVTTPFAAHSALLFNEMT